jgi:hypothetical protein
MWTKPADKILQRLAGHLNRIPDLRTLALTVALPLAGALLMRASWSAFTKGLVL